MPVSRDAAMNSGQYFSAYRRMIATHDDSVVNWWYSGWSFVQIEGQPHIPLMQITAIMTYRAETLSRDSFRIHWSEIGVFKDPASAEIPDLWVNPLTGARVQPPRSFQEGPGNTTVTSTPNGLRFDIVQPHATLRDASVRFHETHGRLGFTQRELKLRGFPTPEGRLPPPGSPAGFEGITELSFFASLEDLAKPANEDLPVQGIYSFVLMGLPPWMGFGNIVGRTVTRGRIARGAPGERLDSVAWQRLAKLFPDEIENPSATRR
jgi:hypothetical protein